MEGQEGDQQDLKTKTVGFAAEEDSENEKGTPVDDNEHSSSEGDEEDDDDDSEEIQLSLAK